MILSRRNFVEGLLGSAALESANAFARPGGVRRVGVLLTFFEGDPEAIRRVEAFGSELRAKGWREDDNLEVEYRFAAGNPGRITQIARDLMGARIEVLVSNTYQPIIDAVAKTPEIPIIFAMLPDPVQSGLTRSISHPDANITGFMTFEFSILGKWIELLKRIVPSMASVALIFNPDAVRENWRAWLNELELSCQLLGVEPLPLPVHSIPEMHRAVLRLPAECGVLIAPDVFTVGNYKSIVSTTLERKAPACFPYRYFALEGGLMSYGPNGVHMFRQAASYVDRILRGAKTSELPIQRPSNFELVLNLKTCRALGIVPPQELLVRADEVVE
ncbi:MAG: ABC transporter substrate-binding protein [Rhodomicrobium sp.]